MNLATQIGIRFREVHLDGVWVVSTNLKAQLSNVTWEQATTKIGSLNTIADLAFHINYYVAGVLNVFQGGTLDIRDKFSFNGPPIESQKDWEKLLRKMWDDAEQFAKSVEEMSDKKLNGVFVKEEYGNYHRNIDVLIEHTYYHLGQIVLLKKLITETDKA